nr:helix-turn-helix domain-containing protein [Pseudarthrobacter sp. C4D7]
MSDADSRADDAALKHGELANLASIHAAAYKASAVVGQFNGDTAIILPDLQSGTAEAGLRSLAEAVVKDARKHLGITPFAAVGPLAPDLLSLHGVTGITEALLACVRNAAPGTVATVDDFEAEILYREAVRNFLGSPFRHRSLAALLQEDADLAVTLQAYFDACFDVAECAKHLNLHKNTVYYRVAKAAKVTGLDFGNPRDSLVALLHLQEWAAGTDNSGRK